MKLDVSTVKRALKSFFNYEASHDDEFLIQYAIDERIDYVKIYCNRNSIPEIMNSQIIKMIMGEFLYQKFILGGAEALGVETLALVSSISEDDTTIQFDTSGDQSNNTLILNNLNNLRYGSRVFLMRYRSVTKKE